MPIDNDYFKNRQQQNQNNNQNKNGNNNGGGYEPPFSMPEFKGFGKNTGLIYGAIIIALLLFFVRPFVIINSGEVGLIKTLGKYQTEPLYPGFHILIPLMQKVDIVDTKVRVINYKSLEDIGSVRDGGILINPAITVLDARGLPVSIELTVQYKLLPDGAPSTIAVWGLSWEEKIVNPVVRDIVRNVVGNYSAEDLPTKRNEIAVLIEQQMRKNIDALPNKPVQLLSVQLREIVLPDKIKEQIEKVQIAKQETQRVTNEVERAKQEAEKLKAVAEGEARAKLIEAEATAQANVLVSRSLSPQLIQLKQIEVQGKFNEALKVNTNAQIFLTPGGSTPNIWVDTKNRAQQTSISK
jgi:regulator of protease activity HflC (stomatin/prohibitin superfamily)